MSPSAGHDPDTEEVRRCLRNEPGAFRTLFERYARRILGTACRITGDLHDAEDVLQEVFLKVHRRLRGFRFESTFSLWIHRIAVHESINWKSRRHRPEPPEPPLAAAEPAPGEERTMSILRRLNRPLRAAVALRYVSGFSYEEIAETLEIPIGTVRSRLFEAHEKLRECWPVGEEER